ncbi:MAG: hypothetical protein JW774_05290 [Candidatus Aureabacteria bacterium]|nr:hypothetical protein [Candidatus Auribacterota bacterium]
MPNHTSFFSFKFSMKETGLYLVCSVSLSAWLLLIALWGAIPIKIMRLCPEGLTHIPFYIQYILLVPLFIKIITGSCVAVIHPILMKLASIKYSEKMLIYILSLSMAIAIIVAGYSSIVTPIMKYQLSIKSAFSSI